MMWFGILVGANLLPSTGFKMNFLVNIKNGEIEKSAVAAHVWKEKHAMDHKPVLLKEASNKQELTNWENIVIIKNKDRIINFEMPPAEGSRSAPTRNLNQCQSITG